jgi:hypothetical protein
VEKHQERFLEKIDKNGQTPTHMPHIGHCWNWTGKPMASGYGRMQVNGKTIRAHRAAWLYATGEVPKLDVLHKCDNRRCVRLEHLFLGTIQDNMADKVGKHRTPFGEEHGRAKITEGQALEIIRRKANGERQVDLAAEFGLDQTSVSATGRDTWKHLRQ